MVYYPQKYRIFVKSTELEIVLILSRAILMSEFHDPQETRIQDIGDCNSILTIRLKGEKRPEFNICLERRFNGCNV